MDNGANKVIVGIADMKIAKAPDVLITYALGSCIGLCFYDPAIKLAALLHIMLPVNMETGRPSPMKYADTGIKQTVQQMERQGALRSRINVKIAGGAKMFEVTGGGTLGNIGQRNIESVQLVLKREQLRLLRSEVGGTVARTVLLDPADGQAYIRSFGKPEIIF